MTADPEHIACWQRLAPDVTTSGKLTADDIAALDALGVRHVINLALAESSGALPDEARLLGEREIRYTHIPVPFEAPGENHFAAFREALGRGERPVHVHCIMNWRVSAFFYRYHLAAGMAEEEARALLERQWSPEASEHADAPAWTGFIAERGLIGAGRQTGARTALAHFTKSRIASAAPRDSTA